MRNVLPLLFFENLENQRERARQGERRQERGEGRGEKNRVMGKREKRETRRETLVARHLVQLSHSFTAASKLKSDFSLGDPTVLKFWLKERHTLPGFSELEKSMSTCSTAPRKGVVWNQSWGKYKDFRITGAGKRQ